MCEATGATMPGMAAVTTHTGVVVAGCMCTAAGMGMLGAAVRGKGNGTGTVAARMGRGGTLWTRAAAAGPWLPTCAVGSVERLGGQVNGARHGSAHDR